MFKIKTIVSIVLSFCMVVQPAFATPGIFESLNNLINNYSDDNSNGAADANANANISAIASISTNANTNTNTDTNKSTNSSPTASELNSEREFWLKSLIESIDGNGRQHPLDFFGLLLWNTFPNHKGKNNSYVLPTGIKIEVADSQNNSIEEYLVGEFAHSTDSNANWKSKLGLQSDKKLNLYYKNKKIHELLPNIHGALVYGDYLVFIQKNHYSQHNKSFVVSFVDLGYFAPALGNTNLPIFSIPVRSESQELTKFEIENGWLAINDFKLNETMLRDTFAEPQRLAFNLTAALSNPNDIEAIMPIAEKLMDSFLDSESVLQSQIESKLKDGPQPEFAFIDSLKANLKKVQSEEMQLAKLKNNSEALSSSVIQKAIENDSAYKAILDSIKNQSNKTQSLVGSISAVFMQLSAPRPLGATSIVAALVHAGRGLQRLNWDQTAEGFTQLANHRLVKWGGPIVAAAFFGNMYPEAVSQFYYQGLDLSRTILEQTFGRVFDLTLLGKEAMVATFSGLEPQAIYSAYFTSEKMPKLAVGFMAIITQLYLTLGIPHLLVNSIKLGRDLIKWDWQQYNNLSLLKKIKTVFIERQNQEQKNYLKLLSESEVKTEPEQAGIDEDPNESVIAEQTPRVLKLISKLEEQDRQDMRIYYFFKDLFNRKSQSLQNKTMGIETFGGALRHFLFSFSAFTNSGYLYGKIWNAFFLSRSFFWLTFSRPSLLLTMIYHPRYFNRIVFTDAHKVHIPTIYNGGTDTWLQMLKSLSPFDAKMRTQIKDYEDRVIALESNVLEQVLKKSFFALTDYVLNDVKIKNILVANGGIHSLSDPVINQLSLKQKTFFNTFFNTTFDQVMQNILTEIADMPAGPSDASSDKQLKYQVANQSEKLFQWDSDQVTRLVEHNYEASYNKALEVSQNSAWNFKVLANNFRQSNIAKIDPAHNAQVKLFKFAEEQLEKPKAVARAVRNMITSNITDKPIELIFSFLLTAGITSGILAPIQDQMFSENSWFYLSRFTFVNGFLSGMVFGILSDVWGKVQQDERLDSRGVFNDIPDAAPTKGFWSTYLDGMRDPINNLWDNQKHYLKLVWGNLPAAFVAATVIQFYSLGRFDADLYVTGYLLGLIPLNPFSGLGFKTENAFEIAAKWIAQRVPKDLRSHPLAIDYVARANVDRRVVYNIYYRIFENSLGKVFDVFQSMSSPVYGTRAFSRILFSGYTVNELGISLKDAMVHAITNVASAKSMLFAQLSAAVGAGYLVKAQIPNKIARNAIDGKDEMIGKDKMIGTDEVNGTNAIDELEARADLRARPKEKTESFSKRAFGLCSELKF